jgi:hypothetical protein
LNNRAKNYARFKEGMFKTTEMRQPLCILSPSFSFFVSVFFDVTEGEKQGSGVDSVCFFLFFLRNRRRKISGVDSVCGVIKRNMVAAR